MEDHETGTWRMYDRDTRDYVGEETMTYADMKHKVRHEELIMELVEQ